MTAMRHALNSEYRKPLLGDVISGVIAERSFERLFPRRDISLPTRFQHPPEPANHGSGTARLRCARRAAALRVGIPTACRESAPPLQAESPDRRRRRPPPEMAYPDTPPATRESRWRRRDGATSA